MIGPSRTQEGARLLLLLGVAALGAGLYLQAAQGPPLDSEAPALQALAASNVRGALAFQGDPDQSRPLSNLLAFLAAGAAGSESAVRVLAAVLHGAGAVLIFFLASRLLPRAGGEGPATLLAPATAGVVFAAHPLASEAVLSHGSLAVVSGAFFGLAALLLAARSAGSAAGGFAPAGLYLAALLCHGGYWPVAIPAAVLSSGSSEDRSATVGARAFLRALAPFAVSFGLFYAAWAARAWPSLGFLAVRRPWGLLEGIASQCAALTDALRLCVLPLGLSVDQGRPAYLGEWGFQAVLGALLLATLLVGAAVAGRRATLVGIALAWMGALHLHLLIAPPEEPLQERRLYPFVASIALLAAALTRWLERRAGARAAVAAAALICIPLGVLAAGRARLWNDPVALWESATRANPESVRGHVALGRLHLERDETELALQSLEHALARSPRSAAIQNSIAEVYIERGDLVRAVQEADKAMDLDPRYLPAYITAGNAFMMRGQSRDAFLAFNAALTIDPEDPSALYNMGLLHFQERQYVKASRLLERAAALRPVDAETHFRLGLSRFYEGNYRGAADALRTSTALDPERVDARVNLAAALTKSGDHASASQILEGVLAEAPGNAEALNGMAILASARNDRESARNFFEQAVSADPNNLQFLFNLGGAYEELGQTDRALEAYRSFLERWRGSLDLGESVRARIENLEERLASAPPPPPGS